MASVTTPEGAQEKEKKRQKRTVKGEKGERRAEESIIKRSGKREKSDVSRGHKNKIKWEGGMYGSTEGHKASQTDSAIPEVTSTMSFNADSALLPQLKNSTAIS